MQFQNEIRPLNVKKMPESALLDKPWRRCPEFEAEVLNDLLTDMLILVYTRVYLSGLHKYCVRLVKKGAIILAFKHLVIKNFEQN